MSSIMVRTDAGEVPAELIELLKPVLAKWETAMLRVAAAEVDPRRFAVPTDKGTPEAILAKRFAAMPRDHRTRAGQRAVAILKRKKPTAPLARFLDLQALDDSRSVDARMLASPTALTQAKAAALGRDYLKSLGVGPAPIVGPFGFKALRLELLRVVCVDETDGIFGTEAGDDEIAMIGMAFDGSQTIGQVGPLDIGSFSDGDRKDFQPAKQVYAFDLMGVTDFPRGYVVTLILAEEDAGSLSKTVRDLIDQVAEEAIDKIVAAIGAWIGTGVGGPIGTIVGLAVGWLVGKVVEKLISIWGDDLFDAVTLRLLVPDPSATLDDSSAVFTARGPGEYAVRYRWKLLRNKPSVLAPVDG